MTSRIYQHWHWSRKNCPSLLRIGNRWARFIGQVRAYAAPQTKPEDEPMTPQERAEFDALITEVAAIRSRADGTFRDVHTLKAITFGNTTRVTLSERGQRKLAELGHVHDVGETVDLTGDLAVDFAREMGLSLQLSVRKLSESVTGIARPVAGDYEPDVARVLRDLADAHEAVNG